MAPVAPPSAPSPLLIRSPRETFTGSVILDEVDSPLGMAVWTVVRRIRLRAESPDPRPTPEDRPATLETAGSPTRPIEEILAELERLAEEPALAADALALRCREAVRWAEGEGKNGVALELSVCAALLRPEDGFLAYATGRLARKVGEGVRAEAWFERAHAVSRASGDRRSEALSQIGLGNLLLQRGNLPAARERHLRALKIAEAIGDSTLIAMASHDLLVLATERHDEAEVERFARGALEAYPEGDPRLVSVAHDVAYFWMDRGDFALALPVFEALLPHVPVREQRLTLGSIARAAGAEGDASRFEEVWRETWPGIEGGGMAEEAARTALALGQGAAGLRDWARASLAAERALAAARLHREGQVELQAEALLEEVRTRTRIPAGTRPISDSEVRAQRRLADELVEALTELQPG